jgi:hypothetical protein
VTHFLPDRINTSVQRYITQSPMFMQAIYLALTIFIVMQIKSAGIVPFIYFQF